jgi:hypothetical protein
LQHGRAKLSWRRAGTSAWPAKSRRQGRRRQRCAPCTACGGCACEGGMRIGLLVLNPKRAQHGPRSLSSAAPCSYLYSKFLLNHSLPDHKPARGVDSAFKWGLRSELGRVRISARALDIALIQRCGNMKDPVARPPRAGADPRTPGPPAPAADQSVAQVWVLDCGRAAPSSLGACRRTPHGPGRSRPGRAPNSGSPAETLWPPSRSHMPPLPSLA